MLEQCGVATAESAALSDQPAVEGRIAINLEAIEKISGKKCSKRSQPLRGDCLNAHLSSPADFGGIDEAVSQVEPDGVGLCIDPALARPVKNAPGLAKAPAQFPPRIVRDIPQQFAKPAAHDGMRGNGQIADERAHLAGCGQGQGRPVTNNRQGPKEAYLQRGRTSRTP